MMRPFEKYPVNHHLAQVLERVVADRAPCGTVRSSARSATFNGDEPHRSRDRRRTFDRFGDSWSSRLTLLPLAGHRVERKRRARDVAGGSQPATDSISTSRASWRDTTSTRQRLAALRARRVGAHERDRPRRDDQRALLSVLGEAAVLPRRRHRRRATRAHRSPGGGADWPIRFARHARRSICRISASRAGRRSRCRCRSPAARAGFVSSATVRRGRAHRASAPGNPPGIFNPEFRYGADRACGCSRPACASRRHDARCGWDATAPRCPSAGLGTHARSAGV